MDSAVAEEIRSLDKLDKEDRFLDRPIRFVRNAAFEDFGAAEVILGPEPEAIMEGSTTPDGNSADPLLLPRFTPLGVEQERHLFRKMNYLRFLAERLRNGGSQQGYGTGDREEIRRLVHEADEIRKRLVEANLGLVVSRAKPFLTPQREMDSFVSEGNLALVRAVTTFDFAQHTRFSTYACAALNKAFTKFVNARPGMGLGQQPESADLLAEVVDYRAAGPSRDAWQQGLREQVAEVLSRLGDRERLVIEQRYGLNEAAEQATLKEVGDQLAISVERVRQLEKKALGRLKELAIEQGLEPFED